MNTRRRFMRQMITTTLGAPLLIAGAKASPQSLVPLSPEWINTLMLWCFFLCLGGVWLMDYTYKHFKQRLTMHDYSGHEEAEALMDITHHAHRARRLLMWAAIACSLYFMGQGIML